MSGVRRLVDIGAPNEARFFLFAGAFGGLIAAVYWFVSYEPAGSVLLAGFGAAAGLTGLLLARAGAAIPGRRRTQRDEGVTGRLRGDDVAPDLGDDADRERDEDVRPFLDESGRVPSPTLAPFALGVGLSIATTSLVFGPAPLLVGAVPVAWGALTWLTRARAELDAVAADDLVAPGTIAEPHR